MQASLPLAEYCIDYKAWFENTTILELGAGVGLLGITLKLKCRPAQIYLTDCHETVLETLKNNVALNFDDTSDITVLNLPWEEITAEKCATLGQIDIIVASDVVYDPQLFHPLADAIRCFLLAGAHFAYLACTKRDATTLKEFWKILSMF